MDQLLNEAMTPSKRKQIQDLIYKTITTLDKTGTNTKTYEDFFSKLSDAQFDAFMKKFLNDSSENFYMEILPYENEPNLRDIKKAADDLGIPLEEYVYYRHDGNKDNPLRTREKVPVGHLHLKRLQQVLSKKNSYSLDIDQRNMKTGQVTSDSKVARISDAENYALTVMGADYALQEFMGPRADNAKKKLQMYQDIATQGYVQLSHLKSDVEDSQTLSTVDVYFTGAGIMTDLLTPGMALPRTLKERKSKERIHTKFEQ
jgi:hypothetical protein